MSFTPLMLVAGCWIFTGGAASRRIHRGPPMPAGHNAVETGGAVCVVRCHLEGANLDCVCVCVCGAWHSTSSPFVQRFRSLPPHVHHIPGGRDSDLPRLSFHLAPEKSTSGRGDKRASVPSGAQKEEVQAQNCVGRTPLFSWCHVAKAC